ncbi:MAG TPA: HAD-IIA family hydrolase [Acidimicrobiales bacterium]|nr:HAD-IIA family hydrolase [Acidimicrobiales bacterium]
MWAPPPGGTWVIDLDGVVWLRGRPIPGVDEAVARLRGAGVRVLFATNNSAPTRAELHRHLAGCGITADDADLLRSADVAAGMLAPGTTAVVLGDHGVNEALTERGVIIVPEGPADAVVVGLTRDFTYDGVARAAAAVRAGARLIGTNEDPTFPTPEGLVPGAGALLAAVATAAEAVPEVAGKPHRPTAEAIAARVPPGGLRVMVGDRPATDGALAAQLGIPFALVLSGVTPPDKVQADSGAAATAADLRTLVCDTLGGSSKVLASS